MVSMTPEEALYQSAHLQRRRGSQLQGRLVQGHRVLCPSARTIGVGLADHHTMAPLRDHSRERNLDLHHPRGRHHTSSSSTRETQDRRPDWMTSRSTDRSSPASRIGEPTENQVPPMTSDLPIRRAGLIAANESIGAMYQVAPPTPSDGSSLPIESCAYVASRPSDTSAMSRDTVHRCPATSCTLGPAAVIPSGVEGRAASKSWIWPSACAVVEHQAARSASVMALGLQAAAR
jgi:hypothetical protein